MAVQPYLCETRLETPKTGFRNEAHLGKSRSFSLLYVLFDYCLFAFLLISNFGVEGGGGQDLSYDLYQFLVIVYISPLLI